MASSVKVELRRTVMTPRGRRFPPRKVEVLHLPSSSAMSTDEDRRNEQFDSLQQFVTSRFPALRGRFVILRKDDTGELVPCNNQAELLNAIQQTSGDELQLFVQELSNWEKEKAGEMPELRCSSCDAVIDGRIVKCLECEHFTLCRRCDESDVHDHHVMVRAERQRFFNFALPLFREILPKLCEEVREKNAGRKLPRLEPREVRQCFQREKKQNDGGVDDERCLKRKHFNQGKPCCMKCESFDFGEEIHCSNCNDLIKGIRVKCLECNVNLCCLCDDKKIHGNHVMVRSDRPRFFNHGLLVIREIIPSLCEEKRRNTKADFIERLTPKDVFQYWRQKRSESGEEENYPFKMRRERMRARWFRLLDAISTDKAQMTEDEEISDTNEPASEAGEVSPTTRTRRAELMSEKNVEHTRRHWMQRCHQQWRQQMASNADLDGDKRKCHRRTWKQFMRNCWKLWQEEMREDEIAIGGRTGMGREERCHARREWMKNCWRLWHEEAEKNKNRWMNDEGGKSEEVKQQAGARSNVMSRRRLFPGYHFLMMKSWKMMQEELNSAQNVTSDASTSERAEKINTVEEECHIKPGQAKHMLKQCWANGCRERWWMEAGRHLNAEESEDEKKANLCAEDAMNVMTVQSNWRCYMHQCWRLWKQMKRNAGFLDTTETGSGTRLQKAPPGVEEHPKAKWIKACWPMWLEEMTKHRQLETEKCRRGDEVKWDKRPFRGWQPLIIQSWRMMQECLGERQKRSEQREMKEVESLKRAQTKMVEKEMKQLSLKEKEMQSQSTECHDGDDHKAGLSRDDNADGDQFVVIRDRALKQYFEMWKEREDDMKKKEEAMECESTNTPQTSPLLRLTLSLKEKPMNKEDE